MGEQYPCGVPRRGHRPCGRRDLQVRRNEVLALPFVPTAIEFLERELIDIVERNLGKLLPVKQGEAVLIVMYDASSRQELDSAAEAALAHGAIDCCDGNIHTEMLREADMSDEEWKRATHASLTELYALSKELGGQLSGEHGSSIKTEVDAHGFYEFASQILFYACFRADAIFSQRNISTN